MAEPGLADKRSKLQLVADLRQGRPASALWKQLYYVTLCPGWFPIHHECETGLGLAPLISRIPDVRDKSCDRKSKFQGCRPFAGVWWVIDSSEELNVHNQQGCLF